MALEVKKNYITGKECSTHIVINPDTMLTSRLESPLVTSLKS